MFFKKWHVFVGIERKWLWNQRGIFGEQCLLELELQTDQKGRRKNDWPARTPGAG